MEPLKMTDRDIKKSFHLFLILCTVRIINIIYRKKAFSAKIFITKPACFSSIITWILLCTLRIFISSDYHNSNVIQFFI